MANTNAPFGFRLVRGEGKEYRVRYYPKKSGNIIAEGDAVKQDASGSVELQNSTGAILGIAMEYKAATDTSDIAICDDPEAVFEIQASANLVDASVFSNADLTYTAPDSTLKRSKVALDSASLNTTATLQMRVIGLSKLISNEAGSYAKALVKINNHAFKGGTGTVGV